MFGIKNLGLEIYTQHINGCLLFFTKRQVLVFEPVKCRFYKHLNAMVETEEGVKEKIRKETKNEELNKKRNIFSFHYFIFFIIILFITLFIIYFFSLIFLFIFFSILFVISFLFPPFLFICFHPFLILSKAFLFSIPSNVFFFLSHLSTVFFSVL